MTKISVKQVLVGIVPSGTCNLAYLTQSSWQNVWNGYIFGCYFWAVILLTDSFVSDYNIGYTNSSGGLAPYACSSYVSSIYDCAFYMVDSCQTLVVYCRELCTIIWIPLLDDLFSLWKHNVTSGLMFIWNIKWIDDDVSVISTLEFLHFETYSTC